MARPRSSTPRARGYSPLGRPSIPATHVDCPFVVAVDSREQRPYTFQGIMADADHNSLPLRIATRTCTLPMGGGDYSIFGWPGIALERKSAADLYGSVGQRRENFEQRLTLMESERKFAAVIVEAHWDELLGDPPRHTKFKPKALFRSIIAWQQRYRGVHWVFCKDRDWAERITFRMLERYWKDHQHERVG